MYLDLPLSPVREVTMDGEEIAPDLPFVARVQNADELNSITLCSLEDLRYHVPIPRIYWFGSFQEGLDGP
jgi:hypothetical protein